MAIARPDQLIPIHFPRGGIDRSQSFERQPVRPAGGSGFSHTTILGVNVLTYEPRTMRARGGSRPGIAKWAMNQVNGSNHIQDINSIVETGLVTGGTGTVPGWGTPTTTVYTRSRTRVAKTNGGPEVWGLDVASDGGSGSIAAIGNFCITLRGGTHKWVILKNGFQVAEGTLSATANDHTVSFTEDGTSFYVTWQDDDATTVKIAEITTAGAVANTATISGLVTFDTPSTCVYDSGAAAIFIFVRGHGVVKITDDFVTASTLVSDASLRSQAGNLWRMDSGSTATGDFVHPPQLMSIAGNVIAVLMRSIQGQVPPGQDGRIPVSSLQANRFRIILVNKTTGAIIHTSDPFGALAAGTNRMAMLETDGTHFYAMYGAVVDGENVAGYVTKRNGTTGATIWTTDNISEALNSITYVSGETKLYVSGPAYSVALDPSTGAISSSGLSVGLVGGADAGLVETLGSNVVDEGELANGSNYNRAHIIVAVSGGTPKVWYQATWQAVTADGGTLSSSVKRIRSAVSGFKLFYVDGTNYTYYDADLNKLKNWAASDGVMPTDASGKKAKLICCWRGRMVLAGFPVEGGKWYMSSQLNAFDWNTDPTIPSATQAVSSSNRHLGQVADVITCLIPYTDDVLIFGGNSSIWQMTGNPMDGGRLNRVSDGIGIAWGTPWAVDPIGNIYFFSNTVGIFTMIPGSQPVRISGPIDDILRGINTNEVLVNMAWDTNWQALILTVTNVGASSPSIHYMYETRTGSWWQVKFADNDFNPLVMHTFQGPTATSRAVLLGSWDGYVRFLDPGQSHDDGEPIESEVYLGPYLTPNLDDVMIKEMVVELGNASGPLTWEVKVGETAEQAFWNDTVATGTLYSGRSYNQDIRRSGHAAYCRLSASSQWSCERISLIVEPLGEVRRRGK